ncbi:MAG: hypothetical protein QOJ83_2889 [Frankiales bacterium]|nr:hypothetical protein [Frankiales bacterium]
MRVCPPSRYGPPMRTSDGAGTLPEPGSPQSSPAGATAPGPPPRRRRRRWLLRLGTGLIALLLVVSPWEWSLFRAMTARGTDSEAARVAEWVRGQGGGGLVTWAENVQYRLHPAKVGGTPHPNSPLLALPSAPPASPVTAPAPTAPTAKATTHAPGPLSPVNVQPVASPALPQEGVWQVLARVHGLPAMDVAYLRPDDVHTSYTTAVVWMNQKLLRTVYHPGTDQPGGGPWSLPSDLTGPRRVGLLAAYNSAFRLGDAKGGFYDEGRTVAPLRNGAAAMITTTDGRVQVGTWGSDVHMTPAVASVRQNLLLIVDQGHVVSSINDNTGQRWGKTISYKAFVWRTGVGVTRDGSAVFAAGDGLSAATLAELLQRAGAVRAMELDINPAWTTFIKYNQAAGPGKTESRLLPDMVPRADRYDTSSTRDFYAVYSRP